MLVAHTGAVSFPDDKQRATQTEKQMKKWEDDIRKWTGLEFAKSRRTVENTEKWRKLVVESSLVP